MIVDPRGLGDFSFLLRRSIFLHTVLEVEEVLRTSL